MLFWQALTAALLSAILYFYSTGLNAIGPLIFIAPLPVLIVAYRSSGRTTFTISFLAYALGGLNIAGYLSRLAPVSVVIVSILVPAIVFSLSVFASRAAALRLKPCLAAFVFPSVWTTYEYLLSLVSPHGTAGSIAYTQTDFLLLIQIASLTGIWGITFMIGLVPSSLAIAWHIRDSGKQIIHTLTAPIALVLFVIVFGWIRLAQPEPDTPIPVGLAATDTSIAHFRTTDFQQALPVVQAYARRAAQLAAKGARVLVLPEKFVGVTGEYYTRIYSILEEAARDNHVTIIAGLNDIEARENFNEAKVFSPEGITLCYDKRYFVPVIESNYYRGNAPLVFPFYRVTAGVEICKDMDFPSWSRQYGERDVNILFVPAWDFTIDGRLHSRMALMRGVEDGFSIVRCAQQGLLTVSDYKGRIVAEKSSSSAPEVSLLGSVRPGPGRTFYAVAADWFAWLNILFVLSALSWLVVHNPK